MITTLLIIYGTLFITIIALLFYIERKYIQDFGLAISDLIFYLFVGLLCPIFIFPAISESGLLNGFGEKVKKFFGKIFNYRIIKPRK